MTKEFEKVLKKILPKYDAIIESKDFWFQELTNLFEQYKSFDVIPFKDEIIKSLDKLMSREKFGFQGFIDEIKNPEYLKFILLIGKMIAICDQKGYNKVVWNPYEDKRHISLAQFTQKNWTICFMLYKLNGYILEKIPKQTFGTFHNAINYLNDPASHFTITSANIKDLIFKYFDVTSEEKLKQVLSQFVPNTKNPLNQTFLYSSLLFDSEMQNFWKGEDVNINKNAIKENLHNIENTPMTSPNNTPLNQILYGPPGTGKTFNTINKALEILGEKFEDKTRKRIKDRFDELVKDGQIMFTTFHQSMSYEDFIEGIKPIEPKHEGQHISYKIIDGIFKRASAMAAYNCYKLFIKSKTLTGNYSFDDLFEAFTASIQEQIDSKDPPVYKTLRGREVEVKELNRNGSIIARAKNSVAKSSAPLTKENLQKLYDRFKTMEEIVDLTQVKETVEVTSRITEFYAVFSGLKEFEQSFVPDEQLMIETNEIEVLDSDEIQKKFNAGVYKDAIKDFGKKADPVVIIIDEINRGNVSQIFGELITLIEEDKRRGRDEALEVILPYSKDKFSVPQNLYIIGTMNTADRSVEALDAALRRRFSFTEMPPVPELIATEGKLKDHGGILGDINLPKLLTTINQRMEKLLDKDHTIGHSYFMKVGSLEDLKFSFQHEIIPLLQEYFYGDFGKIGLVLGKGFIHETKSGENIFAESEYDAASDYIEKKSYTIKGVSSQDDAEFLQTISTLLMK